MKYDSGYVSADCQAPTSATITPTGAVKHAFSSGGDSELVFCYNTFCIPRAWFASDVCRGDAAKFCVFKAIKEISYVMTIAVGNWFSPSEKVNFSDFTSLCLENVLHPFREALISWRFLALDMKLIHCEILDMLHLSCSVMKFPM